MDRYKNPKSDKKRQTQVKVNGVWKDIELKDCSIGDIIRFIEPNGDILINNVDGERWLIKEEPILMENGRWGANCKPLNG